MLTRLSYSKLNTFEQCPLKFRYQYIEEIPSKTTPVLFLGQIVHAAISGFSTLRKDSDTLQDLFTIFRDIWKVERNKLRYQGALQMDVSVEKLMGQKGLAMLENFYRSAFSTKPHESEKYMNTLLTPEIQFVGRIDRIETRAENGFRIIDFKTGKYSERFVDFLQLNTYAWLASKNKMKVQSSVFYFLEENEKVEKAFTEEVSRQTETELIKKSDLLMKAAEKAAFPRKIGPLCPYCDYDSYCRKT